jgi:signal transduction histidine kinase
MQAAVARRYVDIDLERARAAAAIVAEVAADAERDLTRLTEFLDTEPPADVKALVGRWRAAGLPVTLENGLDELRAPLPIAQVAFRIVQEALTNVARHAGDVPTSVTLAGDGVDLVIEVVNRLASGGAGTRRGGGIVGMRERAESYGGTLEAGPDGRGAWRVRARVPLGRPARPLSSLPAARS